MFKIGQTGEIQNTQALPQTSGNNTSAQNVEVGVGKHVNENEDLCKQLGITEEQLNQILANPEYADFLSLSLREQNEIVFKLTVPQKDNLAKTDDFKEPENNSNNDELREAKQHLIDSAENFNFAQYDKQSRYDRKQIYAKLLAENTCVYEDGIDWTTLSNEQKHEYIKTAYANLKKNGESNLSQKMLLLQTANYHGMSLDELMKSSPSKENLELELHSGKITQEEYDIKLAEQKEAQLLLDERINDYLDFVTPEQQNNVIKNRMQKQEVLSNAAVQFLKSQNADLSEICTDSTLTPREISDYLKPYNVDENDLIINYLENKPNKTAYENRLLEETQGYKRNNSEKTYQEMLEDAQKRAAGINEKAPEDMLNQFRDSGFYEEFEFAASQGDLDAQARALYKFTKYMDAEDKINLHNALLNDPKNVDLAVTYGNMILSSAENDRKGKYNTDLVGSTDINFARNVALWSKNNLPKFDSAQRKEMYGCLHLAHKKINETDSASAKSLANTVLVSDTAALDDAECYMTSEVPTFQEIFASKNVENKDADGQAKINDKIFKSPKTKYGQIYISGHIDELQKPNRKPAFHMALNSQFADSNTEALAKNERTISSLDEEDQQDAYIQLNNSIDKHFKGKKAEELHNNTTDQIQYCSESNQQAMYEYAMQSSNAAVAEYAKQAYETRYDPTIQTGNSSGNGSNVSAQSNASPVSYQTNPIVSNNRIEEVNLSTDAAKTVYQQLLSGEVSIAQASDSFNKLTASEKQEVLKSLPKSDLLKLSVSVCELCPEFIPAFVDAHRGLEVLSKVSSATNTVIACMKKRMISDPEIRKQFRHIAATEPWILSKASQMAAGLDTEQPHKSLQLRG